MPFVKPERRKPLLSGELKPEEPGDLCFLDYNYVIKTWTENPRWTTIHNVCKTLFNCNDSEASKFLAFLEFYLNHGHEYEIKKKSENGDI